MVGSAICPRCGSRFEQTVVRCPDDSTPLLPDRTGSLVAGRFLLEGFLGATGAGASVWRASEIGRPHEVAIKLASALDSAAAGRFERGARLVMEVDHPAVATVFEHGRYHEFRFLAMELLDGESLQVRLQREGRLPAREAVEIVLEVLDGLVAAHEKRIVHRDLKPGNIFIAKQDGSATPQVKILDFGIAKRADRVATTEDGTPARVLASAAEITARHHICGTPEYMAPEQILGQRITTAVDLYAVGALLHRLLTGNPPFSGRTRFEVYHKHLTAQVPPIPEELAVQPELDRLIRHALAKEPADRPASASAFRDELARVSGVAIRKYNDETTPSPIRPLPGDFRDDGRTLEDDDAALAAYGTDRIELRALLDQQASIAPALNLGPPARSNIRSRAPVALGLITMIVGAAFAVIYL